MSQNVKKQSVLHRTLYTYKSNDKIAINLTKRQQIYKIRNIITEKYKKQPYLPLIVIHVTLNLPPLDITPLTPHP